MIIFPHEMPPISSEDRMHVLASKCWCKPTIETVPANRIVHHAEQTIDDSSGEPVPDSELPDGLVVTPATDNVAVPYPPDVPAEPAEGE